MHSLEKELLLELQLYNGVNVEQPLSITTCVTLITVSGAVMQR
jgi:hypothetical protein